MKVVVLPSDDGAVGHYRMIWPAQAVQKIRPDWDIDIVDPRKAAVGWWRGKMTQVGFDIEGADLVVVQRLGEANHYDFVRAAHKNGIAVVLDTDDALWCIERDNKSYAAWNNARSPLHWRWLDNAAREADLVTVTTDALARRYAAHGRSQKIPNGLPDHAYPAEPLVGPGFDPVVIGWSGRRESHPHDLRVMGSALATILAEDDKTMVKIVGDAVWAADILGVPRERLIDAGRTSLEDYHAALTGVDIGIVPLQDNPFNRSKSWLKALEYSAVGAYVVASDTPANRELARHSATIVTVGGGEEIWTVGLREALKIVRAHPGRVATSALRDAKNQSITARAEEWAQAWERAVSRRKALDS